MAEETRTPLRLWAEELHQGNLALRYRVKRTLFSGASEFQQVDVVETYGFGRMLFIDSLAMASERDEFVYHEMISHVPLFVHPGAERVLVIGGGDGGTVREVVRHPGVRSCRLVEIDGVVVEACREHLRQTSSALDDPRVEVTIGDGVEFVRDTAERFDLVIVDSTDPIGPATPLFGESFYRDVQRVLGPDGIVVAQAESPYYEPQRQRSLASVLRAVFGRVHVYNYTNLTYPGGLWSFMYSGKGDRCPVRDFDRRRVERSGLRFRYYGPAIHTAAFALPQFQSDVLDGLLESIDWPSPR